MAEQRARGRRPQAPQHPTSTGTGVFRPHVRGFGFVDLDEPQVGPDGAPVTSCFVPPPMTGPLLDGDLVEATFTLEPEGRGTASAVTLKQRTRERAGQGRFPVKREPAFSTTC